MMMSADGGGSGGGTSGSGSVGGGGSAPTSGGAGGSAPASAPVSGNAGTPGSSAPGISQGSSAPPSTPTQTPAPSDWTTGFNDDHRGFVQNKGWRAPAEVVDSYRNLEKLVGAPPDQIIKLAKEDDAAGWDSIYSRLGRPATPEGYKIEVPKEGGSPEFAKWASNEFFKAGLSEKQAKTVLEGWNNYQKTQGEAQTQAFNAKVESDTAALKKEWGAAYDQNLNQAKRAAREFGVDPKVIDAIESSSGLAATMKLFQTIGAKLGDASFVNGSPAGNENGPMTPQQAMDQIKSLKGDPGFVKKYTSGDADARSKMERLHKYAFPDS